MAFQGRAGRRRSPAPAAIPTERSADYNMLNWKRHNHEDESLPIEGLGMCHAHRESIELTRQFCP